LDVDSAHLRIGNAEGMFGAGLAPASILCTSVGTGTARHIANPLERLSYIRTTERNAERMNCIQGGRSASTGVAGLPAQEVVVLAATGE
jgi:hypothetical protein